MIWPKPGLISVPLAVGPLSSRARGPSEAHCLGCGSSLALHQPDGDAPQRLLGTCDRCGRWHLIDCDGSFVVLLPAAAEICDTEAGARTMEAPATIAVFAPVCPAVAPQGTVMRG